MVLILVPASIPRGRDWFGDLAPRPQPEDLARLVNEPDLMPVAIEEFLRFYAPVTMARLVKHDMSTGCPMKEDDWILLVPGGNRDPVAFKEPTSSSSIERESSRRLWTGHTPLRRIELARLEMRVALESSSSAIPASNWPIRKR